jgi:hypothetical protein
MMINHLEFYTLDLISIVGSNVPFIGDTTQYLVHFGARMFKYTSMMGIFSLPPLYPTSNVAPINMISSFTSGSLTWNLTMRMLNLMECPCHSSWFRLFIQKSYQNPMILVINSILIWSIIKLFLLIMLLTL